MIKIIILILFIAVVILVLAKPLTTIMRENLIRLYREEMSKNRKWMQPWNNFSIFKKYSKEYLDSQKDFSNDIENALLKNTNIIISSDNDVTRLNKTLSTLYKNKEKIEVLYIKPWEYDKNTNPLFLVMRELEKSSAFTEESKAAFKRFIHIVGINIFVNIYDDEMVNKFKELTWKLRLQQGKKLVIIVDQLDRADINYSKQLMDILSMFMGAEDNRNQHYKLEALKGTIKDSSLTKVIYLLNENEFKAKIIKSNIAANYDTFIERYISKTIQL